MRSAKSKRAYDGYLKLIEAKFGTMPIAAIEDKRARGEFKIFRSQFSATPRKADYVWTTLASVLSVAKDKGKRVTIPVGAPLKVTLDAALKEKRDAVTILTNTRGLPWTEDGFRTSWGKAFDRSGLNDLHFHDLRGTAVRRLALAGCNVPEIASITGYSLETVQQILDAHHLGGRVELAESAINKLNAAHG